MSKVYYQYPDGDIIEMDGAYNWISGERLPAAKGAALYRAQCAKNLRALLKPGQKVFTTLLHVSSSGMSRRIKVTLPVRGKTRADDTIRDISHLVAGATGRKMGSDGGVVMGGCGMDMGFALVYEIGEAVWPKGTRKPHGTRNGQPDKAGGYALKHVWL